MFFRGREFDVQGSSSRFENNDDISLGQICLYKASYMKKEKLMNFTWMSTF